MSETRIVKKSGKIIKILLISLNVLLLLALAAGNVYQFLRYRSLKGSNLTTEQRIAKYEKEIAKSYTLPQNDKSTLADVKNAADLKKDATNGEFFKDAADGDILLVYNDSKLGILYRPTTKKIVKAGPVAFKQQITMQIFGEKTDRDTVVSALKNASLESDIKISAQSDAKVPITAGTIVVDMTGKNAELSKKIAAQLKGQVGNVPEGQELPSKDVGIVVYVGAAKSQQ